MASEAYTNESDSSTRWIYHFHLASQYFILLVLFAHYRKSFVISVCYFFKDFIFLQFHYSLREKQTHASCLLCHNTTGHLFFLFGSFYCLGYLQKHIPDHLLVSSPTDRKVSIRPSKVRGYSRRNENWLTYVKPQMEKRMW